jgi:hypothetical protein
MKCRPFGALLLNASLVSACGARTPLDLADGGEGGASAGSATHSSASSASSSTSTASSSVSASSASASSASSVSSSTGAGGGAPEQGCSDGEREGFVDLDAFPFIAGCSGGWSVPGVLLTLAPACGGIAGDDGPSPSGVGCSVADLCAPGWHVCASAQEVADRSPTGCAGASDADGLFFVTRQSSNGCGLCASGSNLDPDACDGCSCVGGCAQTPLTANDIFGCGTAGAVATCPPLDRFSNDLCGALGPPWSCSALDGCDEAHAVTKSSSDGGGALCCVD